MDELMKQRRIKMQAPLHFSFLLADFQTDTDFKLEVRDSSGYEICYILEKIYIKHFFFL